MTGIGSLEIAIARGNGDLGFPDALRCARVALSATGRRTARSFPIWFCDVVRQRRLDNSKR